jgi:hypothetical protein
MTHLRSTLFTAIAILFFILLFVSMHTYTIEPFGIMGCSKIPFGKFIKDTHTQSEYDEWKKNTWDKYKTEDKNAVIDQWDKMTCEQQKGWHKMLDDKKKKREAVDTMV